MPTVFGDWLKAERKKKQLTQDQLAEISDLTKAQISRLESGVQGTKRPTAVRIATALGADPREALEALNADTPGLEPQEMERIPDPDREMWVGAYDGLTETRRKILLELAEQLREDEKKQTIGGGGQ